MKPSVFAPFLVLLAACGGHTPEQVSTAPAERRIAVTTAPVVQAQVAAPVIASGLVVSASEARLSFKTGGVIQRVLVDDGDRVRKGQLLATLNLTEINAQVTQAREGLQKAERDLQRVQNLYNDSVATLQQLQDARTGFQVSQEQVTIAQYNQQFSEIRAPRDGVILRRLMNEGEITGPGNPVFMMNAAGAGDWVVQVGLPDKDWARVKPGDAAQVTLDAFPGTAFTANITTLAQGADPMSGLYQAELRLNTGGKSMASGLFASIRIEPRTAQTLFVVPIDALVEGNGKTAFVFVPEADTVRQQPVQVAFLQDGNAYLYEGLQGITRIVSGGSAYLTQGSQIILP